MNRSLKVSAGSQAALGVLLSPVPSSNGKDMKITRSADPYVNYDAGLGAVTGAALCDWIARYDPRFVLAFGVACAVWSACMFLRQVWILGLLQAVWSIVATRRWLGTRS